MGLKSQYAEPGFWLRTLDRAIASAAQSATVLLTTDITGILQLNFVEFLSVVGLSTAASVAMSIAYPARVNEDFRGEQEEEQE